MIHALDNPINAHKAKKAADSYSEVAPDAAHALHMPSHIYLALGDWYNVVDSNIDSWNASVKMKRKNVKKPLSYHSLSWLHYGLIQLGEFEKASTLFLDIQRYVKANPNGMARSYLVSMKGVQLLGQPEWNDDTAALEIEIKDLHLTKRSGYNFVEGLKTFYKKDKEKLKSIIEQVDKENYAASLKVDRNATAMCNTAGNPMVPPNQIDIDLVEVMVLELKALLSRLEGDTKNEIEYLKKGFEVYNDISISFGPPVVFQPIYELYGERLLESGNASEALKVFEKGLSLHPSKSRMVSGALAAAKKMNNLEKISEFEEISQTKSPDLNRIMSYIN